MSSKRNLSELVGQAGSDIRPAGLKRGRGLDALVSTPGETRNDESAEMRTDESAEMRNRETAGPPNREKVPRKSRGILVHPRLYKVLQGLALEAEVKDYEVVDAAFAEYLRRRGLLPAEEAALWAALAAQGLVEEDSHAGAGE